MSVPDDRKLLVVARVVLAMLVGIVTWLGSLFEWVLPRMGVYQMRAMDLPYHPGPLERFGQAWQWLLYLAAGVLMIGTLTLWLRLRIAQAAWIGTLFGSVVIIVLLSEWDYTMLVPLVMAAGVVLGINWTVRRTAELRS
jgi:hypothetical protein